MNPKIPVKSFSATSQKLPTLNAATIHDTITATKIDSNGREKARANQSDRQWAMTPNSQQSLHRQIARTMLYPDPPRNQASCAARTATDRTHKTLTAILWRES
jgi:hypothetical protein